MKADLWLKLMPRNSDANAGALVRKREKSRRDRRLAFASPSHLLHPSSPKHNANPHSLWKNIFTMSSPTSRRSQRTSQSATPRRSTRNSHIPSSSPLSVGADQQLRSEASDASQRPGSQATPRTSRLQSNVAASSPLFFRSSPVNSSGAANGAGASSSLGQPMEGTDGDRTPRASGQGVGGIFFSLSHYKTNLLALTH